MCCIIQAAKAITTASAAAAGTTAAATILPVSPALAPLGVAAAGSSVPLAVLQLGWKPRREMDTMLTPLARTVCSRTLVLTMYCSCVRITVTPCRAGAAFF